MVIIQRRLRTFGPLNRAAALSSTTTGGGTPWVIAAQADAAPAPARVKHRYSPGAALLLRGVQHRSAAANAGGANQHRHREAAPNRVIEPLRGRGRHGRPSHLAIKVRGQADAGIADRCLTQPLDACVPGHVAAGEVMAPPGLGAVAAVTAIYCCSS